MAHFKVLSQKLPLGGKENHETSLDGWHPLRDLKWRRLENTG